MRDSDIPVHVWFACETPEHGSWLLLNAHTYMETEDWNSELQVARSGVGRCPRTNETPAITHKAGATPRGRRERNGTPCGSQIRRTVISRLFDGGWSSMCEKLVQTLPPLFNNPPVLVRYKPSPESSLPTTTTCACEHVRLSVTVTSLSVSIVTVCLRSLSVSLPGKPGTTKNHPG